MNSPSASPKLSEITTNSPAYGIVERLWLSAFPEDERRPADRQRHNVDSEPRFHCLIAGAEDAPEGLFTYWDFGRFAYCEHFATAPELRGQGIGSAILDAAILLIGKPLILEAEPPELNDMADRRINFYRRNGLSLWDNVDYQQPPYRDGGKPVTMKLMSTPGLDPASDSQEVIATLRRHVYNQPD